MVRSTEWFIRDVIFFTFSRSLTKCSSHWCLILLLCQSSGSIRARIWRIMMVKDPRHLGRPSCFDGCEEGRYDEWRFQLVAYLAAGDPRFGEVADNMARRVVVVSRRWVWHEPV